MFDERAKFQLPPWFNPAALDVAGVKVEASLRLCCEAVLVATLLPVSPVQNLFDLARHEKTGKQELQVTYVYTHRWPAN